jgi:hypothetical protein
LGVFDGAIAAYYQDSLGNASSTEIGRPDDAEQFWRQALAIAERAFGSDHPETARSLTDLGTLLADRGRSGEAEVLLHKARTLNGAAR